MSSAQLNGCLRRMFDRAPVPSGSLKRHFTYLLFFFFLFCFLFLCKLFCLLFISAQEKHYFKLFMILLFDHIYTARLLNFMQAKGFMLFPYKCV